MISALELKNKLESFDKNTPLLNYNIWFGFLPAIILFPLYLISSTNHTESSIIHSPFLFGFGFAGFFVMCLVFSTASLMITYWALGRYIAAKDVVRRFNVNGILQDDFVIRRMAKGLDVFLFNRLWSRFMLLLDWIFEEIKQGLRYEIEQSKKEILEKVEDGNRTRNENERFYINQNLRLARELEEATLENIQLKKDLTKSSQADQIVDDLSSKVIHKQKIFDKSQTRLDEFIHEH